jgi:hypothetical protein
MMRSIVSRHQAGAVSFKFVLVGFAALFTLIILAVVMTAPTSKSTTQTPGTQNGHSDNDVKQPQQSGEDIKEAAFVPLPDGFRRFTNKKYQLSLAYPESWGGFSAVENSVSPVLRAETKEISHTVGTTPLAGKLTVGLYTKDDFQIAVRSLAPILQPDVKDDKLGWKVATPDPADTKYRTGNPYPIASQKSPSGVEIFDFSWLVGGRRQARWLYTTKEHYVLISVPPLAPSTGTNPRQDDLVFYKAFAESLRDTVMIPPAATTKTE